MNEEHEAGQKAKNFIQLLDSNWNTYVSKHTRTNFEQNKWNKADVLPLTEDVVRGYYRLYENTIQLAKISKLLLAIEQGASSYKGKSLDEIDLNLDDTEPLFSMDSRSAPESQECSSDEENDLCGPADNGNDADADSEAELGLSVPKKQRRNHATSPVPDNDSDSDKSLKMLSKVTF
ncbi:hypothetical protein QTP70_015107 [Hemibagrus guttatus]|uniref:Uncharacterized protein n=1 Tax=Hemibagrus guttatus TaxID=175788 RepID=A0AAE0QRR9_9TELE|nr:hypothetical protein QTP70_015107 [Hemibagrus guttatus]